jgi:hypothetical protein
MYRAAALVLIAGCAGGALAAPDPAFDVRVTEERSTGSFDEPAGVPMERTTVRLRYRTQLGSAQAELPWLRVAGAGEAALPPGLRTDQGVGDARVKFSLPLRAATRESTGVDLVLRAKVGRGRTVGALAPAAPGQAIRLALERPMDGWTAFGHVGMRRAGDLPGFAPGRHAWVGQVGASRLFTAKLEAGAALDVRGRMPQAPALAEASVYAAVSEGDWRWQVFLAREVGRRRADVAAGIALRGEF